MKIFRTAAFNAQAKLQEFLKEHPQTPGLTHFLNSVGFDENGKELEIDTGLSKEERKKKHDEWREREYEHMPA